MTFAEIMKRIAERFAALVMGLLGLPVRALGIGAAIVGEAWRLSRQTKGQHHEQANEDDDETKRLLAELALLKGATRTAEMLPDAHKEAKPSRRLCGSREDPEGGAPAAPAPAPASRTLGRVPAARVGHRLMLLELPENDAAEDLGLDAVLPVLR